MPTTVTVANIIEASDFDLRDERSKHRYDERSKHRCLDLIICSGADRLSSRTQRFHSFVLAECMSLMPSSLHNSPICPLK